MNKIFDILKGFVIGIANVIPGFSGGTMAVILKIYDRLIEGLSNILKHPIKVIKDLWAIVIGLLLGIIFAIFAVVALLTKFPLPTTLFFVGLIIGSIPSIFKESTKDNPSKINYIWLALAFIFMVAIPFINLGQTSDNLTPLKIIIVFVMGVISAAAMVIPGVSGSLTLMALGYYTFIMTNIKGLMENFIHFNFAGMKDPIIITIAFAIGIALGVIAISKLINLALKKNKACVYFIILGLMLASPISIIYKVTTTDEYIINYHSVLMWISGILLLIIGTALPLLLEYYSKKIKNNKEIEENKE
ncbi:MAG: DUF368 domain-containing protein [Anaeroplasmataceae bacterium]